MSPRLPKVIYQIFNLQLLRRYDGPKNRTVQSGNKQEGDKYASFGYSLAYLST
ncbi:hypothetical protein [Legionella pneumophila]|uniref:hypothetical protein n=1 Tax=Legionella pneumophila TaxID=446 RepID=UPI0012B686F5|nr:hypothetical protein [Legionella pneumophila]